MQARLVIYKGNKTDLSVPVAESGAGIGREPGNHVQLASSEVSKRHAFLQRTADGWCIRDLNSRNGLFVNGRRVREAIISDGDRLTVGPCELVFQTAPPGSQYKPLLEIDLSSKVAQRTMATPLDRIGRVGNRGDKP